MSSNCGAGEDSWKFLGQQGDQTNLKGDQTWIFYWKDWCWSGSSSILVIWCKQTTHCKSPWCWEGLRAEGEEGIRGWDGWLASLMQWTWTWPNSGRWWGTVRPGVLQSMVSQSRTWLGNWTTLIDLLIWCHIGFRHTAMIQLCIYICSEYLRIEAFELYFSNSLGMLGKWAPARNTSVHSIADCLQLGAVNYKLALTESIANNWTMKAFAICL